ncbi:hypothetical protein [Actinomycetospora lemnae]|uniref:Uncharacterized protein n=1 Tax=Actinomycetospora lemnae TaxID=3019891 RepID=A0ABT5STY7_9PSEU|nr:hypothetical protein [Actinomycetospora sp. DW7H6]MDD7966214.1 hypothetical protein [Actinomycetospora sp. DW7H6]
MSTSQLAAQWVSAIGSAGSLLGFAAYVWIMLLNRKDQVEVRQEQQAQGVTAWLDEGKRHDRDEDYVIVVHNGGESPVFQVRCLFSLPSSDEQHSVSMALLPPASDEIRSLPFGADEVSRDELYSAPAVPEMRFTDSHGTHWGRDSNGQLHRLDRRSVRRKPSRDGQDGGQDAARDDSAWEQAHRERADAPREGASRGDSPQDDHHGDRAASRS